MEKEGRQYVVSNITAKMTGILIEKGERPWT
jgi:hypothetical protein